jgi:hypothetical protein
VMLSLTNFADEMERERAPATDQRRDGAQGPRGPRHARPSLRLR